MAALSLTPWKSQCGHSGAGVDTEQFVRLLVDVGVGEAPSTPPFLSLDGVILWSTDTPLSSSEVCCTSIDLSDKAYGFPDSCCTQFSLHEGRASTIWVR